MFTPSWFFKPDSQLTDAQREQKQAIIQSQREWDRRMNPAKYLPEFLKQKSQSSQMIGGPGSTWKYAPGTQFIGGPDAVLKQGSQPQSLSTLKDMIKRIPPELHEKLIVGPGATTPEKYRTQSDKYEELHTNHYHPLQNSLIWQLEHNQMNGNADKRKQYADMYSKHDGKRYATRTQTQPIFGKDPITWSPQKSSQTEKVVTRKSMGLGALLNIAKLIVPSIWQGTKWIGDSLVSTFFQGGYGDGVSDRYIAGSEDMDGKPSASEVKGEEILVATQADLSKRQIFAAIADQSHIESSVLNMPIIGLKHSQVTISLHLEYTFSPAPTDVNTQIGIPNVNFNDHVVMHLMPKNFAFYKNLLKHELIKFNRCTIVSSNTSGFDTTTNIGFFPSTKDTTKVSNAVLLQMSKRLELDPEEKMAYTIRYVSPDVIEYEIDDKKNYRNIKHHNMFLEPNKIIRTENLASLAEDEGLSYGTVIIVKQNVGTIIGMSYTVNMVFDTWDYIINGCRLEDVEDKNLDGDTTDEGEPDHPGDGDGDGDGSGSGNGMPKGTARVGRRQIKK